MAQYISLLLFGPFLCAINDHRKITLLSIVEGLYSELQNLARSKPDYSRR